MRNPLAGLLGRSRGSRPTAAPDPPAAPPGPTPRPALDRQIQILLSLQYRQLAAAGRSEALPSFDDIGFDVWSSTNEDGILLYLFSLLGFGGRRFVDIGAGSVEGSNVANLILNHGFEGLLIDADAAGLQGASRFYAGHHQAAIFAPQTAATRVTAENINATCEAHGMTGELDLLCLDIDGVDYWIWRALEVARPRVVVVEYQDILGPERAWTVPYRPDFDVTAFPQNRTHYNYCGASLTAFVKLGRQKGYRLVGCNRGGWNAFFVAAGHGEAMLPEVSVESCFRYAWNAFGMRERFALVRDLEWQEV